MPEAKLSKNDSKTSKKVRLKLSKKPKLTKKLPSSFRILNSSFLIFKSNWKILGGITLVYALLSIILVQSNVNLSNLDEQIDSSKFNRATEGFNNLISSFSNGDSFMQFILFLLVGLTIIWAARHLVSGEQVSIRQAYYQSMTPLVPVLILIVLFCVQLLPMLLVSAGMQFSINSVSSNGLEKMIWLIIFVLASMWSLFMISRTSIAIFIATLPGMTPLTAMKKAKELVQGRRFSIIRKLIFLPIVVLLALGLLLIPIIIIASVIASPLFLLLGPLAVTFSILYLFVLYQEVIK